ncbi:MAG: hypothetical protein KatS3mg068_2555 [Candidatus Sericytochromatia bacterium]|nr:MAG: hypothetical protein KatS3mg068_2555 [Candidatus Sericytochromatia bacterium]
MTEELITEVQVFEDFTDDEVLTISNYSYKKFYQRGEVIFEEESDDTSLYIVLAGQLEVLVKTEGKKEISLSFIDEGEVFGELSFLDGRKRSAKIVAKSDVELLQLTRSSFDRLRLEHPDIASKLIMDLARVVSLRLRNADKFIVDVMKAVNNQEKSTTKKSAKKLEREKFTKAKNKKTKKTSSDSKSDLKVKKSTRIKSETKTKSIKDQKVKSK